MKPRNAIPPAPPLARPGNASDIEAPIHETLTLILRELRALRSDMDRSTEMVRVNPPESLDLVGKLIFSRLPQSYLPASWRNTTPVDDGFHVVGLGFDLGSGEVIRLGLDIASAEHLAQSLAAALLHYQFRSHSPTSVGMPKVEVSTPDDGVKV